jgi:hypothetical protein
VSIADGFDEKPLWDSLLRHGFVTKGWNELTSPEVNAIRHVLEDLFDSAGFANKAEVQESRLHQLHNEIRDAERDLECTTADLSAEFRKLEAVKKQVEDEHLWCAKLGFPVADRAFAEAEQALKSG